MFWVLSRFSKFAALSWFSTTFFVGLPISGGNRYTGVILVSRFAIRFRPGPDFGRSILISLPFSGFDRSADGFSSTEIGIFGTTDVILVCRSLCRPVDRWFWFHRSRDFQYTGRSTGLPILVWDALPGLFSIVVSSVGFWTFCALAHDI